MARDMFFRHCEERSDEAIQRTRTPLSGLPRRCAPRNDGGFTLIEILIVMVIISIVAGAAVMSINFNQRKQIESFTKQLSRLFQLAEQEAMYRPAALGFAFSPQHYQFYIYARDKHTHARAWRPLKTETLGLHTLPNNTFVTLKINNESVPADGTPHLIITADGSITPFVMLIGKVNHNPAYQLTGKADGEITYEVIHEE